MSLFAGNTGRRVIGPALALTIMAAGACGGGGAAVEPGSESTDSAAPRPDPAPAAPSSPPSGTVVTTTDDDRFNPAVVTIAPGGGVTWQFTSSTHNVTFTGTAPAGGNIPDTGSGGSATRIFPAAGTWSYQCTRHSGMTGQVIVGGGAPPPNPAPSVGPLVQVTRTGLDPERVEITPGSTVTWEFVDRADGIVFEDDSPPGGNIPESPRGSKVSRTFPSEGDYGYSSAKDEDVEGRVRVR